MGISCYRVDCLNMRDGKCARDNVAIGADGRCMGMTKLAPCPFCGSDDVYLSEVQGYMDSSVVVFCNSCKVSVLHEDNEQEGNGHEYRTRAVEAWNRRAEA